MLKKAMTKPWVFFVVLGIGIGVAVAINKAKPPVTHQDTGMKPTPVRVIQVEKKLHSARVIAHGDVEPAVELNAKAEVSGKISYLHPELKSGNTLRAGTVVVRIDPEDFQVSLKQSEADLSANRSSLSQLQVEESSTRRSLQLAEENLRVGEKELARVREVFERKLISKSAMDQEEQKVIQLRQQVEDLRGNLNAYTSRKANIQAQIGRSEQQVKGQQTTLGRTEVIMPFDGRIGDVPVETGEFTAQGATLFEATNLDGVEIKAQLTYKQMGALFSGFRDRNVDIEAINSQTLMARAGLESRVRLVGTDESGYRQGRVVRIGESMDENRRTATLVVAVDKPYSQVIPGKRPPLIKGMFTEVELSAPEAERIVIPRRAIHRGRVYLMSENNTLEIRPVEVDFTQGDEAIIAAGLDEGERVIVNDLTPVIPNMPLTAPEKGKNPLSENAQ